MGLKSTLFGGGETTTNPAFVDKTQQPFLKDIYERSQTASYGTGGQDFAGGFMQPSYGAFNNLATGGSMIPGLQQGLTDFSGNQNQYLDSAVNSGLDSMAQNFQRNIMPSINQGAALNGTSGGSRQGIAQGMAANDFNKESSNFINQMYSGNFQDQMRNNLTASGQLVNMEGQRNQATTGALSSVPNISNLGFDQQFGNLRNYKDLVGSPTVLSGGGSSTTSSPMFAPIKLQK